ncbi:MAG TPA: NADH-quinone oxidoreductase subunit N [Bacteroidia bacterium]|nr:NADH-quinone oxidoreductase subunit N [Bacteroidia bacterium]
MNEFLFLMKHELLLTLLLFILLFLKLGKENMNSVSLMNVINILLLINFVCGFFLNRDGELFNGMFRTNSTIAFEKNILNLGTFIISMQAFSWLKNHKHLLEFYMLLLSTLTGMFFMISSNNLLMFYLGLELSTIPLAALSNFDLEKRQSSEAAMKMIMSSAFSSGILLFGISIVYGTTGTLSLSDLALYLDGTPLQLFAFILLFTGFAFKMSAVPFHLWTADVYEGSPVPVTSYLSVISKGAIIFVFVSVLYSTFKSLSETWYHVLYLTAVFTMIIGNLFAIRQNNLKRFLAFSSIAQVGFILIGISGSSQTATASVIYFILIYVFSNLGAFGVISVVSALTGKENMDDYKGFYKTNPMLSWVLTISLFSLAGIPPTAGFFGKLFLLTAGAAKGNYLLITIAALNMVVSLYYYLKVVKTMFMDKNEEPIEKINAGAFSNLALMICVAGIIIIGFVPQIYEFIYSLSFGM